MTKDELMKEAAALIAQVDLVDKKLNGLPWVILMAPVLIAVNVSLDMLEADKKTELEPLKELMAKKAEEYSEIVNLLSEVDKDLREKMLEEYEGTDSIESEGGELVFPERWSIAVVDASKIERKYLMPDYVKARADMNKGLRKIKGFKIEKKRGLTVKKSK